MRGNTLGCHLHKVFLLPLGKDEICQLKNVIRNNDQNDQENCGQRNRKRKLVRANEQPIDV